MPAALRLTLYVTHELMLGRTSRWAVYFTTCPTLGTVPLAAFWEETSEARRWAAGTELEKELRCTAYTLVRGFSPARGGITA
jgi:hypothetical protein